MSAKTNLVAWELQRPQRPLETETTPTPVVNHSVSKPKKSLLNEWKDEFTKRMHLESKSRKEIFVFSDACTKIKYHTDRDKEFLKVYYFLKSNPLNNNDYFKYVNCYFTTGTKLNEKYFRNNLSKLHSYYKKIDELKKDGKEHNPFKKDAFDNYVLFMCLKLSGFYTPEMDSYFNVKIDGSREFNPLTSIPSVLRGVLPYEVKEYDIKRAFPSFIDVELGTDFRHNVYEVYDKTNFQILINTNTTNKTADRSKIIKELSKLYGSDAENICTLKRFNNKGETYKDFSKYEKQYIDKFINENKLSNYVRLHDGIFVLKSINCNNLIFDKVEFSIKECIKPAIENEVLSFYEIDENNTVTTSPVMYSNFFTQEKFIRISTPDDKIFLLRDTNNVVDYFNHITNTVAFLKDNINEYGSSFDAVANTIAKESSGAILNSFKLMNSVELNYYSDTKNTFGLPFKNGFYSFDVTDGGQIKRKEYRDVEGFFPTHEIQNREFEYTDEVGMFEQFLIRSAIGQKEVDIQDRKNIVESFKTMFGYLCHSYKDQTNNPCIVLTDMEADDESRNGRRGKSLLLKAVEQVQESITKGGKEFDSSYTFVFADLEKKHNVYIIDDVPAGFNYDDLYTNILGSISCQRKGLKAELIQFKDTPKFAITSNWVVPYDEKNASTNGRFVEYKFTNYYNTSHTPKDEFNCAFFQDWKQDEWNRFYSFVFRCVKLYLEKGIVKTLYNKTGDNYKAYFSNDVVFDEFERIVSILISNESFNVASFLKIYDDSANQLRFQKIFTTRNTKKFIDVWVGKFNRESQSVYFEYSKTWRKWIKKTI